MREKILIRFRELLDELADFGREELRRQGHKATGRGIASLEGIVTRFTASEIAGAILANDYLIPVDTGVPASRIPFSPGSGAKFSLYIQGLIRWAGVVKPGLSDLERKSFAFAVAYTQLREGMPTRGSYSFSNNGRRKNWVAFGLESKEEYIEQQLRLFQIINDSFETAISEAIRS